MHWKLLCGQCPQSWACTSRLVEGCLPGCPAGGWSAPSPLLGCGARIQGHFEIWCRIAQAAQAAMMCAMPVAQGTHSSWQVRAQAWWRHGWSASCKGPVGEGASCMLCQAFGAHGALAGAPHGVSRTPCCMRCSACAAHMQCWVCAGMMETEVERFFARRAGGGGGGLAAGGGETLGPCAQARCAGHAGHAQLVAGQSAGMVETWVERFMQGPCWGRGIMHAVPGGGGGLAAGGGETLGPCAQARCAGHAPLGMLVSSRWAQHAALGMAPLTGAVMPHWQAQAVSAAYGGPVCMTVPATTQGAPAGAALAWVLWNFRVWGLPQSGAGPQSSGAAAQSTLQSARGHR